MPFQKPRILNHGEANYIRGKCLVAAATAEELMQLIGHFDLVEMKLRGALEALAGAMPPVIYVYGDYGDKWSADEPHDITDEYETVNFKELLEAE